MTIVRSDIPKRFTSYVNSEGILPLLIRLLTAHEPGNQLHSAARFAPQPNTTTNWEN